MRVDAVEDTDAGSKIDGMILGSGRVMNSYCGNVM